MAEMKMLKGEYDSALYYNSKAFKNSPFSSDLKITSIILFTYGYIYTQLGNKDSALFYYYRSLKVAIDSNYLDFILYTNSSIALLFANQNKPKDAQFCIQRGVKLLEQPLPINSFYVSQFYDKVISVYEKLNIKDSLVSFLKRRQQLQTKINTQNSNQLQKIFSSYAENENKLIRIELSASNLKKNQLKYIIATLLIGILAILSWVFFIASKCVNALKLKKYC